MRILVKYINKVTNLCLYIAGIMLCLTVAIIITEIILRRFFNSTLYITDEYSGYLLCGIATMGMAFTLREGGHIRMTALYGHLSDRNKLIVDKIIDFIGLIFFAYLTFFTANFFWESAIGGVHALSISETYIAIPQILMPLGFLAITFQFLEKIYYDFNEENRNL